MRWTLLPLLLLAVTASAETWRWVDEDGVVNFSDQPRPGAERVELQGLSTFSPPEWTAQPDEPAGPAAPDAEGLEWYSRLAILSPVNEETIWNNQGNLDVALTVEPRMRQGDRINLYLDGEPVNGLPPNATRFTINRVFRGGHTLRATVVDRNGAELFSSDTLQFYVRQTSLLNPQNSAPGVSPTPPIAPRPPIVQPRPRGGT
jgi:hypothetical protein